jgi:hypothetical protein
MRQLLNIINQENKKNPLTDEEIATRLGRGRSDIVKLRRLLGIGNSRQRITGKNDSCFIKQFLNTLAWTLVSQGHVREQYIVSIYEREALAQTLFQDVALPHGRKI